MIKKKKKLNYFGLFQYAKLPIYKRENEADWLDLCMTKVFFYAAWLYLCLDVRI